MTKAELMEYARREIANPLICRCFIWYINVYTPLSVNIFTAIESWRALNQEDRKRIELMWQLDRLSFPNLMW